MFSLLSAVLWLGNIQYRVKTADSVDVVPSAALSTAAALLRVPEEKLVFALCKRKITAGATVLWTALQSGASPAGQQQHSCDLGESKCKIGSMVAANLPDMQNWIIPQAARPSTWT